ncbi:MAG TPA: FtsH protease activity modulator HflK [Candidatus Tectomicrobia bacterium]|nr:FtsH protease activity modulator HflK [Candidatus Tectomicrobia bacterium]
MAWDDFNFRKRPGGGFGRPLFRLPPLRLRQISPQFFAALVGVIAMIWLASGSYTVGPDQRGIVLRFGKHVTTTEPGFHWHWPYPVETVLRPKVTEVQRVEIGFRTIDSGPPARFADVASESLMLTGDENIIDIDLVVQYRIADPAKYLFSVRHLSDTVKSASEAALREVIGRRLIDEALTVGKLGIQEEARALLQSILNSYASGLHIVAVQLQEVQPPKQVSDAFKDVASAREDKVRFINEAEGYRSAVIPEVRGRVEMILREAEAYREEKTRRAQGETERFLQVLGEYQRAKEITRKRLLLETLEVVLPQMDKIILEDGAGTNVLPLLPLGNRENRPGPDGASEKR